MPSKLYNFFEFKSKNLLEDPYLRAKGLTRYIIPDDIFKFYSEWAYHLVDLITPLITMDGMGFYVPITCFVKTSRWEINSITYGSSYKPNIIELYMTDIISSGSIAYGRSSDDEYDYLIVDHSITVSNMIFFICHEISHIMMVYVPMNGIADINKEEAKVNAYVLSFLQRYEQYFESIITNSFLFNSDDFRSLGFKMTHLPGTGCITEGKLLDNIIHCGANEKIYNARNDKFVRQIINTPEQWYYDFFSDNFIRGYNFKNLYELMKNHSDVYFKLLLKDEGDTQPSKYVFVQIKRNGMYLEESIPNLVQAYNQLFGEESYNIYENVIDLEFPELNGIPCLVITNTMKLCQRSSIEYEEEEDGD